MKTIKRWLVWAGYLALLAAYVAFLHVLYLGAVLMTLLQKVTRP